MNGRADQLVDRVVAAHRGERLAEARSVRVRFSSGGLAFAIKGQPDALIDAHAVFAPTRQEIRLRGQRPAPWEVSVAGPDELRARLAALHRLRWTPEDVGAFAAGALWTYLTMPLLLRAGPSALVGRPRRDADRLAVVLDDRVAGHSPRQVLHADASGLLVRHDYVASAFGRWAHAAQTITDYTTLDGVVVGTRRRVTPRLGRWQLPGPVLVWIQIHDLALDAAPPPAESVASGDPRRDHAGGEPRGVVE